MNKLIFCTHIFQKKKLKCISISCLFGNQYKNPMSKTNLCSTSTDYALTFSLFNKQFSDSVNSSVLFFGLLACVSTIHNMSPGVIDIQINLCIAGLRPGKTTRFKPQ